MKIAVEGCAHGELDNIYETIKLLEQKEDFKIDLLICCGDFQSSRNENDLRCMAVPPKYYNMCSFYKYYNGEKVAPVLTIFIGGNHESSNYLQELPYGGWVAPNIFYLGYAGVINIAGIRIGGISGIYKAKDYMKGHYEHAPYSDSSMRSVYHIRNLEIFRLKQLSQPIDVFLSHDWPSGIWEYGNKKQLLSYKPYFENDMSNGDLGSKPCEELLHSLKPKFWFAAHLHCKFAAVVPHSGGNLTKFLALDKCLPKKRFLQVFDIAHSEDSKIQISYDLEWLTILRLTNHLLSVKNTINYLPGPGSNERWCFTPTDEEKEFTNDIFGGNLYVPQNFQKTVEGYSGPNNSTRATQPQAVSNAQTILFCKKLYVDDPVDLLLNLNLSANNTLEINEDSIDNKTFIDDTESSVNISSPEKRPLNLPEPINNDDSTELSNCNISTTDARSSPCEVEQVEENDSIGGKRFKRRNASIYQND